MKEFNDLLKKAEHIVNRIKSKAIGGAGLFVNGNRNSVHLNLPMTPIMGARTERSWHFDISNDDQNRSSRSPHKIKVR